MLRGLKVTEGELRSKNIPIHLLRGEPGENIAKFALDQKACAGKYPFISV